MTKNNEQKTSLVYRSIPQIMTSHLPGSVKPMNDIFYKIDKITVGADNLEIKDIIYNDLLSRIYNWIMFVYKDSENALEYKLSDLVLTNTKQQVFNNFSFNHFQEINDFNENNFAVSEIIDTSQEEDYQTGSLHKGSYFPFTWKCNHCNILFYSKKRPSKKCSCGHTAWKQLNIALVSASSKFYDLKSIAHTSNKDKSVDDKSDYIRCSFCKSPLRIKESHNLSQYRLTCSKHSNHHNSIDQPKYTLYSLYSYSLFYPLKGEVVNFNQQDLILQKKSTLINEFINKKYISSNDRKESSILQRFQFSFKAFMDYQDQDNKNYLYNSLKDLESITNFKKQIHNLINANKIVSDEEFSKYYNQQILDRIEDKDMININKPSIFSIEKVGLLRDIQVINYVYGYSRISDNPISTQTGLVKLRFFFRDKKGDYSSTSDYFKDDSMKQIYFSQESNKGIYFKLNNENLENFLLSKIHIDTQDSDVINSIIKEQKFIYLHSLCHYLIRLISQNFSGISTSSLTELIFPEDGAFLIYKKGTGKELGYLEAFFNNCIIEGGSKFNEFWDEVNNKNNLSCPGSELCKNACIECLIISKHSCKHKNEKLDRKLLLG